MEGLLPPDAAVVVTVLEEDAVAAEEEVGVGRGSGSDASRHHSEPPG